MDIRQTADDKAREYRENMFIYDDEQPRYNSVDIGAARYVAFKAGAEWARQKAIEAHWESCPNLSKDNERTCNHTTDCDRRCMYMTEFINQFK